MICGGLVVCEASGMLGQQYVESMMWEVSEWRMRSAVCCVSGVGSMVCMVNRATETEN